MAEIVLVVEYVVKPEFRDAYLARVRQHRKNVLANEPGCRAFDILTTAEDPNKVLLYEVYEDQAAFDLHTQTPYMAEYRVDTEPMSARRVRNLCRRANGG
jgi:autoinducer 2-degrading protein